MKKNPGLISFLKGDPIPAGQSTLISKIKLTILMLIAILVVNTLVAGLQMMLLRWGITQPIRSSGVIPEYMKDMPRYRIVLEIVLLAPLLEETAFRGILQNNERWFRIALVSLAYLIICRIFSLNFYELSWPTSVILFAASLLLFIRKKYTTKITDVKDRPPFRLILIWLSAIAFGFWHYYNFDFSQVGIITIAVSLLPFAINGLLLSYVAAKNGLSWSILLHMANNAWPMVLWF
ncbi:CPBP family glutamic-type intramembrane protease [uncultured Chryseobacterium sp.]|uniref:CPBP family glutamic-type intramembrane protease n=1 Tax=uncultured Chryseobacterium sp. TaxID=259322 RepID=UPI0025E3587A|nr:CPBP family glutamic-type intramembrane protease [uncultured Chryseobacterium sp.]